MKIFNLLNIALFAVLSLQIDVIYVLQSTGDPPQPPDGSENSPFSSLNSALEFINSSTDIIFQGQNYTVKTQESFNDTIEGRSDPIQISIRAQNPFFVLKFESDGLVSCSQDPTNMFQNMIRMSIIGIKIEISEIFYSDSLFKGNCYFTFQNLYMSRLNMDVSFLDTSLGTGLELKNITVDDISSKFIVNSNQGPSQTNGTVNFYSVNLKTNKLTNGVVPVNLGNYQTIAIKSSSFENIGIKAMGLTGNSSFQITNTTVINSLLLLDSFTKLQFQDSLFHNSSVAISCSQSMSLLDITINNITFQNVTKLFRGSLSIIGLFFIDLNVSIRGSRFIGNNVPIDGGALKISQFKAANITVINSNFEANTASIEGGAIKFGIFSSNLTLNIENCTFQSNSVIFNGGVFHFQSFNPVQIIATNSIFKDNYASQGGVFHYIEKSRINLLNLENNIFESNRATASNGGGVFFFQNLIAFYMVQMNNIYVKNKAESGSGGVLHILKITDVQINTVNCSFISNDARLNPGGVFRFDIYETTTKFKLYFERNKFESNLASKGSVFSFWLFADLELTIKNDTYVGNIASSEDGTISLSDNSASNANPIVNITASNSSFVSSNGGNAGGFISSTGYLTKIFVKSEYNIFDSNIASKGALFCFNVQNQVQISIENDLYVNNQADNGHILMIEDFGKSFMGGYIFPIPTTSTVSILNSKFFSNLAKSKGGIYLKTAMTSTTITLSSENNIYTSNSASVGALYAFEGLPAINFSIKNETYNNNKADSAGIISIQDLKQNSESTVNIINSTFLSNIVKNKGGIIYLTEGSYKILLNCEKNYYQANMAYGGGVYYFESLSQLNLTINNDSFENNIASVGGVMGAKGSTALQYLSNFSIVINNSRFWNNSASRAGGTFSISNIEKSYFTITNSEFQSNSAKRKGGGALFLERTRAGAIIRFENNTFEYNSAATGAVIDLQEPSQTQLILLNSSFGYNKALRGATVNFQSSQIFNDGVYFFINNSKFYNNEASDTGGSISIIGLEKSMIEIMNNHFRSSKALYGGVIYAEKLSEGNMTLQKNIFDSNEGYIGGVVYFRTIKQHQINFEKNIYIQNTAASSGGVGYITESTNDVKDFGSNFTANKAKEEGGVWFIESELSTFNFENMTFEDSFAMSHGGCIYNSGSYMRLSGVIFKNCSTFNKGSSGGALYLTEKSITRLDNLTFINNQAEFGASVAFQSSLDNQQQIFSNLNLIYEKSTNTAAYTIQNQVQSTKGGGLILRNISISKLHNPFLFHSEGVLQIEDITINDLKCEAEDGFFTFCLFSADNNNNNKETILNISRLSLENVSSTAPLILAKKSNLNMKTINIINVKSNSTISVGSFIGSKIIIEETNLLNISSNFIKATADSSLYISKSALDNEAKKNDINWEIPTQFIILSESSLQIESTVFRFNSLAFPQQGGAIQLIDPKTFKLTHNNFTTNRATQGGAVFIQASSPDGTISHCLFSNNLTPKDKSGNLGLGGAIYLQKSNTASSSRLLEQQSTLLISDSIYEENSAFTGGAIYTKEVGFTLQNSVFDSNQAISGGGLATNIEDPTAFVNVIQSEFKNNMGTLYGASTLELRRNAIDDQIGTNYLNETQHFTRGVPAKLRIRTFLPNGLQNLGLSSINITELENNNHITLEYDSSRNDVIRIMNEKSGQALNRLVEISVWDNKNNHLTELTSDDGQTTIEILNSIYPTNSIKNISYLAGNTQKTLTNGSSYFLQETSFFAFPRTSLDIRVTMSIVHRNLGNIEYVLNENFRIELSNCAVGEIFSKDTLICDPCKTNYFSLTDPFTTNGCQKCDIDKADCPGGSTIYPKPGYWRIGNFSDNLITCPFAGACL